MSVVSAAPAAAEPEPACSWTATPIPPAESYGDVNIQAASGRADYAGTTRWADPTGVLHVDMVLWNRGDAWGRVHAPPPGFKRPAPVDENASGTVLLTAQSLDGGGDRAFTYAGEDKGTGVYRELRVPAGYRSSWPTAINDRGDALGHVTSPDGPGRAVVWPADGGEPVVIDDLPPDNGLVNEVDLDDDGTVLLALSQGPHLWRDGHLSAVAHPDGYGTPWPEAIRNGKVVGFALTRTSPPEWQGFLWTAPDRAEPIQDNAIGEDINSHGLVIGRATLASRGGVWSGTTPSGDLPGNLAAIRVSDDDSVLGTTVDGYAVWRRTCVG